MPFQLSRSIKQFNPADVHYVIQRLQTGKAPDFDYITSKIVKNLPNLVIFLLTLYFPLEWKFSIIKIILKPNKSSQNVISYRPISLLPVFGKILKKWLLKRIQPILREQNITPDHQFGFQNNNSTIHQWHRRANVKSSTF